MTITPTIQANPATSREYIGVRSHVLDTLSTPEATTAAIGMWTKESTFWNWVVGDIIVRWCEQVGYHPEAGRPVQGAPTFADLAEQLGNMDEREISRLYHNALFWPQDYRRMTVNGELGYGHLTLARQKLGHDPYRARAMVVIAAAEGWSIKQFAEKLDEQASGTIQEKYTHPVPNPKRLAQDYGISIPENAQVDARVHFTVTYPADVEDVTE